MAGPRTFWLPARTSARRRILRTSTAFLAVIGLVLALTIVYSAVVAVVARTPAGATVPGTPGVPQAGTPVYTEDFSNQDATSSAISVLNYVGSSGSTYTPGPSGTGADGQTYTADTQFTPAGGQCDGWILNSSTPVASSDSGCSNNGGSAWANIQAMAVALGQAQGQSAAAAAQNQALSEFTNAPSGNIAAGVEYQSADANAIPSVSGHDYAVAAYFAENNCQAAHASETFTLLVNGTSHVLSSGLDPCGTTTTSVGTKVTKLQAAAFQIPVGTAPSLGLQLSDQTATGSGNDVAFDLPQIVDVTPQLDKAFSPTSIPQGGTSTLTYTVTNTSELDAKSGIAFTDDLPSGLTATGVNVNNCGGTLTASAGATSAVLTGAALALGATSCTITVQVTASVPGTYVNGPTNFPSLVGVNPPGTATQIVQPVVDLSVTKSANIASYTPGSPITYTVTVENAASTASAPISTATDVSVSDPIPSSVTGAAWTCAPSAGASCAAGSGTAVTDTVTIPAGGQVVYTVTGTVASGTTGSLTNSATAVPAATETTTGGTGGVVATVDAGCPPSPGAGCSASVTTPGSSLSITKTPSPTSISAPNQAVTYTFVVTNTGQSTLTGVTVADAFTQGGAGAFGPIACQALTSPGASCSGNAVTLVPGQVATFTASYTTTQADVDAGAIKNSATATGTPPSGPPVTAPRRPP